MQRAHGVPFCEICLFVCLFVSFFLSFFLSLFHCHAMYVLIHGHFKRRWATTAATYDPCRLQQSFPVIHATNISIYSNPAKCQDHSTTTTARQKFTRFIHMVCNLGSLRLEDNKESMGGIWQVQSLLCEASGRIPTYVKKFNFYSTKTMPKLKGVMTYPIITSRSRQHQSLKLGNKSKFIIQPHYPPEN